jgi:hypothetical protein
VLSPGGHRDGGHGEIVSGTGGPAFAGKGGAGGDAAGLSTEAVAGPLLVHDTISGNATGAGGPPGVALGGAPGGSATSSSPGRAGLGAGVFVYGSMTLRNSIVASNAGGNCYGSLSSSILDGAHNISFPDTSCPGANVDPRLGPPQDNGGPTLTQAIAFGSPALDAVPATGAACEPTDQRGVLRPAGAACDIGAFELATAGAVTGTASGLAAASATLNGSARNPDIAGATAFVQYGPTSAYGSQTAAQAIGSTTVGLPISASVTGLLSRTTYHFRAVVTNSVGTVFGADETAVTTGEAPPALRGLSIRPSRLLPENGRGASVVVKLRRHHGATIAYSDSEAASSTLTVQRPHPGFRSGRLCTTKPPRHHKGRVRRCTRFTAVGGFTHADRAGANAIRFTGRIGGHALKPGSYRLVVTPRANRQIGNSASASFHIL